MGRGGGRGDMDFCESCRFWDRINEAGDRWGWCRAVLPSVAFDDKADFAHRSRGVWPRTEKVDWCSSWKISRKWGQDVKAE